MFAPPSEPGGALATILFVDHGSTVPAAPSSSITSWWAVGGVGLLVVVSLALTIVAGTTLSWMLHAWRTPGHLEKTKFTPLSGHPALSFSLLVPARHEAAVLADTLEALARIDHPSVQILTIVGDDDPETDAVARRAAQGRPDRIQVIVDRSVPKNKPKALNSALAACTGDVVGVFDAEDEVHPLLLRHIDARFSESGADVVQGGVQLMNAHSSWWALRNVLEYYFWFRSRLHYHAARQFVPLGGNTVFIRTSVLRDAGGWDPDCLSEDCEIGVRLSSGGAGIAVAYEPAVVTREETPGSVRALIKQRTRWNQGFLQVLAKGEWRKLPTRRQRLLARYTLSMPFLQAATGVFVPISVLLILFSATPVWVVLLTLLPIVPTIMTVVVEAAGYSEFCRLYGLRCRIRDFIYLALGAVPYQLLLAFAALRAAVREVRGEVSWEKTEHGNVHRNVQRSHVPATEGSSGPHAAQAGSSALIAVIDVVPPVVPALMPITRRVCEAWQSLVVLGALLVLAFTWHFIGMARAPLRIDDEGTYVAQAYAIQTYGTLGHYTYWYDHPPFGWIQLAAYTWTTDAFSREPNAVLAGREAMLVCQLISCVLVWVLCRRLLMTRWAIALAVALFSLSPLAVQFHRTVYLDNIATPWLLGSLVLALSPQRRLWAFAGSGLCFGTAVLTKETSLLLAPAVAVALWHGTRSSPTRRYALSLAGTAFPLLCGFYVMYAAIKGELLSGAGHVSLIGGIGFQLFFRQGTGSMLDGSSLSRVQVDQWLHLDPVFPLIAVACVAPGALIRRLRPIAVGLAVPLVAMLRPGYLPVPYVIAMLPFAGVLVAGVADAAAAWLPARWKTRAGLRWRPLLPPLVLAGIACAALATPIWVTQQRGLFQPPLDEPLAAAQTWVERNVPRDARLAVDDAIWVDLVRAGFPRQNVVWYYKIDTDPAVALEAPGGWRDYDYVVSTQSLRDALPAQPQLASALASSLPIATFGAGTSRVDIHRVIPQGLSAGSPNSTRRLGSRN